MRPGGPRRGPSRLAIGLAGIVVIGIAAYLAWTKQIPFVPHYQLHAVFSNSSQIIANSPVREAGIDVGKVTSVDRGPGRTVEVTMAIDDAGQPVHSDAIARIRPRVFLEGGFFVDLNPGSPEAPTLHSGATLPVAQTAVPVQFDQILSVLRLPVRNALRDIVKESATSLANGGAAGFKRAVPPLAPTLRDVAIVTRAARGTDPADIGRLLRSTADVTETLADRDAAVADLVRSLDRTSTALTATPGALGTSIAQVDALLREAPPELAAIDRAVPAIDRFAAALRPTIPLAPPILRELRALDRQLGHLGDPTSVAELLDDLAPTFANLPNFSLLSRGLFPVVGPLVSCTRDNVMPTLERPVPDGPLSTGQSVWRDFLHANVGFASASQDFDANGAWLRYLASIGPNTLSTGAVPGVGSLVGTTSSPLLGSRPAPLAGGATPPLRPDAPCTKQAPPRLRAATAPAEPSREGSGPSAQTTRRQLERLLLDPSLGAGGGR